MLDSDTRSSTRGLSKRRIFLILQRPECIAPLRLGFGRIYPRVMQLWGPGKAIRFYITSSVFMAIGFRSLVQKSFGK